MTGLAWAACVVAAAVAGGGLAAGVWRRLGGAAVLDPEQSRLFDLLCRAHGLGEPDARLLARAAVRVGCSPADLFACESLWDRVRGAAGAERASLEGLHDRLFA